MTNRFVDKDGKKVRLKQDGTPDRRSPPREHQFKKGESGNASGRPKGRRTLSAAAVDLLDSQMTVKLGGKAAKMSRADAVLHALVQRALTGCPRAIRELRALLPAFNPQAAETEKDNEEARREFYRFVSDTMAPLRPFDASGLLRYEADGTAIMPRWIVDECRRRYSHGRDEVDHGEMVSIMTLPKNGQPNF